jgi:hypothetical protein
MKIKEEVSNSNNKPTLLFKVWPQVTTLPKSLLEMQILWTHPDLLNQKLHFKLIPRGFLTHIKVSEASSSLYHKNETWLL